MPQTNKTTYFTWVWYQTKTGLLSIRFLWKGKLYTTWRTTQKQAVVQSLNHVQLFVTPWTTACQASLSFTTSWTLFKLTPIESMMPSNHSTLCHPFVLLPSIFYSIRVFSNESDVCTRWTKYWSFGFSISPSNEYSGLISFSIDWFYLLVIQGTLKSLLQQHSSKASVHIDELMDIIPPWEGRKSVIGLFCHFIIFSNWRIIALQNFVYFCQTSTRISHRYTQVPSLLNLPPHPSLLDCHRAPVWVPWVTQEIPIDYLFYIRYCKFPCYSLHISHPLHPPLPLCP